MRWTWAATLFGAWLLLSAPTLSAEQPQYNRVSLNESAETEVDNDLMVAVLFAQAEGRDAVTPADQVNREIDWALGTAKGVPAVKVQTLGYQTQAVYDKNSVRGWRVMQSLRLESTDGRALGDLVATLQSRLQVMSIAYELSDSQRRSRLDELTATALDRFQARAEHVAKTLKRSGFRLARLNIDDSGDRPMPLARGMTMAAAPMEASVAPVRLEAGTRKIAVTVSGEIELNAD